MRQINNAFYEIVVTGNRVPQRWVFAIMGILAIVNAYSMRVCLSIAITEMTVPENKTTAGTTDNTCPVLDDTVKHSSGAINSTRYHWKDKTVCKTELIQNTLRVIDILRIIL